MPPPSTVTSVRGVRRRSSTGSLGAELEVAAGRVIELENQLADLSQQALVGAKCRSGRVAQSELLDQRQGFDQGLAAEG